jgi:hypothetical protein
VAEALATAWVVWATVWVAWAMDVAGNREAEERLQRRDYFNLVLRIILAPRISRLLNRFAAVARR